MSLLIKGGHVIDPSQGLDGVVDIRVEGEEIVEVGPDLQGGEIIDATGYYVSPGFVDVHVHFREPGQEYKETIATGSRAAARGGFTSVICMPNTEPAIDTKALVDFVHGEGRRAGLCRVYCFGAITKARQGAELSPMAELAAAGAVGFSDDGDTIMNAEVCRRAYEYAGMLGLPLSVHCEDRHLVGSGVMNEGYMSTVLGLPGIPSASETIIVAREIELARLTKTHVHINHLSTKESVELIRLAKRAGIPVSAEVTPHHLILTDEDVAGYDTNTKMRPPLRTKADREALRAGLADGTIDCIATDHAPHAREEKEVEYNYAANGIIGLETAWPLVYTHLVLQGVLTLSQAIGKLTWEPARLFKLPGGSLAPGGAADLTIWDPETELEVTAEVFQGKSRNSPFMGKKLKGWPILTLCGGKITWRDRV
ncbi:MAG: dihydroorotase [Limnochordia bacterium]|jgi:dihydroorotase